MKYESKGEKDKTESFNLSKLLDETIDNYDNENIQKKFEKKLFFNGRKNLIRRCINNLIDNSIRYSKNILVNLEKDNSNILLFIDDDGPGIPKEEYHNIIKPFYKIDKSRSESKSSVGLGLAISSDIIKSHGGDIKFDKSKLGGLRVIISLPF